MQTRSRRTPFLTKQKPMKEPKRSRQEKTFAAKLQSIHFLPPQQIVRQTSRAFPAIIPVHGWKTIQMNPVGKVVPKGSSRQPPLSARMKSEIEKKTRRAKKTIADKWFQSKQHLSSTREFCFVTLGFPVPDTDHQKRASSFVEALDMARLYIATWLQAVTLAGPSEAGLYYWKWRNELAKQIDESRISLKQNKQKILPLNSWVGQKRFDWFTCLERKDGSVCFVLPRRPPTQSLAIPCEPIVFPHRRPTVLS